jgi:hypothetical protein
MPPRGVFRRPPVFRRRRFVPTTFASSRVVVWRRNAHRYRQRARIRRIRSRLVVAQTTFAATQAPALRHRLRRIVRRAQRQRARFPALGFTAAAAVSAPTIRRVRRPARHVQRPRVRRASPHGVVAPYVPAQGQVFVRFLRAISRIRRAAQRRLFWRPPPEIIPAPEVADRVPANAKGRIFTPGLIRGRVHTGDG